MVMLGLKIKLFLMIILQITIMSASTQGKPNTVNLFCHKNLIQIDNNSYMFVILTVTAFYNMIYRTKIYQKLTFRLETDRLLK